MPDRSLALLLALALSALGPTPATLAASSGPPAPPNQPASRQNAGHPRLGHASRYAHRRQAAAGRPGRPAPRPSPLPSNVIDGPDSASVLLDVTPARSGDQTDGP